MLVAVTTGASMMRFVLAMRQARDGDTALIV